MPLLRSRRCRLIETYYFKKMKIKLVSSNHQFSIAPFTCGFRSCQKTSMCDYMCGVGVTVIIELMYSFVFSCRN